MSRSFEMIGVATAPSMGAAPLFTVVVTTHNRSQLLPRAVDCVLAQTCGDFEVLVIDNGSTDGTPEVMRRYTDLRLTYIRNDPPTTSCDQPRNRCLARARGAYIAFLDDDDLWYPDKLLRVKEAFAAHPDAAAVCHYENLRVGDRLAGVLRHGPWSEQLFERLLYERNCLSSCATTLRTDVLRALNGFTLDPEMDGVADYDLWLRLASQQLKVHFIEEPLGEFCETGTNLSVVDPRMSVRLAHIVKVHLLAYEQRRLWRLSRRGMWRLMQMYFCAFRHCSRSGDYWNAARYGYRTMRCLALKPALVPNVIQVATRRSRVRHRAGALP